MSDENRTLRGRIPFDRLPDDLIDDWIAHLERRLARKRPGGPGRKGDSFARAMTRAVQGRHYHGPAEEAELTRARDRTVPAPSSPGKLPRR